MVIVLPLVIAALVAGSALAHETDREKSAGKMHADHQQKAFGIPGNRRDITRTVEIHMRDEMRFVPDRLDVRQGETVRLKVTNDGKLAHELVIGTTKELDAHAAMMMHSGMPHDEPYVAHVAPGRTGEIVWKFNRAGRFDFACLVAGHYQAGMVGRIDVTAR